MKKPPKPPKRQSKSSYDLQAGLRLWQRRLRLVDWDIQAAYVTHLDDRGLNAITGSLKCSTISINAELRAHPVQAELTLVHELLHIHFDFARFSYRKTKGVLLEQAIESLAKTLVELKHGN